MTPAGVKAQQRQLWDDVAPAWRKHWTGRVEPHLAPVTEALLDMARLGVGHWVLDVASGAGDPALAAARRVGPQGRVVGVDLSRRMVAIAAARATQEGLPGASFQELDAEELEGHATASYDAVLSRFGLSFLPRLDVALLGLRRVLMRGAWLASASFGAPERVPLLGAASGALADVLREALPPPELPGPFALARPGVLEQALSSAGFRDIHAQRLTVVVELPAAAAWAELLRESTFLGPLVAEDATVPADEAWRRVEAAAAPFADAGGKLTFPCDVTCVAARNA